MAPVLRISGEPEPEAERIIADGLNGYNDPIVGAGYFESVPLYVLVTDPVSGEILGGIRGRTSFGLMTLTLVYLPRSLRGQGLGARMLTLAEDEGRRRGCRTAILHTHSFQAPGFYQRQGWHIFGEFPCDPPGTSQIFLSKNLR